MYDSNSKGISYTTGFFILISFVVAGILLSGVISIPIWTNMTGTSYEKMTEGINDPANAGAVKIIQCITEIVVFFITALLSAHLLSRDPLKLLGYSSNIKMKQAGLVLLIMLAGLFVSSGLSYFNSHLPIPDNWKIKFDKAEQEYNSQVEVILNLKTVGDYLVAVFIMAIIPALCEETLFRGGLQNFLTRGTGKPWLSIIIVSLLFSAAHWSFYGFLYRFFLGLLLGIIYHYSGKIWLNILGHFFNNAIAITVVYISTLQGKPISEAIGENANTYWGIAALPVVIILIAWFIKNSTSKKEEAAMVSTGQNNTGDSFS
jgi:membrane protease YdiL (CAAX protease family)